MPSDRSAGERRNALACGHPDVIEDALLRAAEHYEQLSADERVALADKLHDAAMRHFYVMYKLNKLYRSRCEGASASVSGRTRRAGDFVDDLACVPPLKRKLNQRSAP